ncbi:hypothetical protein HY634_02405 [Candidatus Uhrbacteria bacterium]|nr:hypothetical protein [Candidatus Uhrbacteria bacterium]
MTEGLHTIATMVHLMGTAIGIGSATVSDVLFFRFLRDYRISREEQRVLSTLHPLFWTALGILVLSGIVLIAADPTRYLASSKLQLKLIVVGVIILNGIFLNFVVSPRLRRISFGGAHLGHHPGELHHLRHAAFASGAISLTSWYIALVLGSLRSIPLSLTTGLLTYVGVLAAAVAGSQLMERYIRRRQRRGDTNTTLRR